MYIPKTAKGIAIAIKGRKSFESETWINLYNTLKFPYISYAIHIRGEAASIYSYRIYVLQKIIVRYVCVGSMLKRTMMTLSNGNIFRVTGHLCG